MTDIEIVDRRYRFRGTFVSGIVNTLVGIIELLLLARIVLELFGASTASAFVAWLYNASGAFMGPFAGAFPGIGFGFNSVLDIVAILAMIAYAISGWLVIELVALVFAAVNKL